MLPDHRPPPTVSACPLPLLLLRLQAHCNWKATKEYLNQRGTKIKFFECAFGPLSSHPFSLIFPPLSPFGPCSLPHHFSPLHLPLHPPFFWLPKKSDLGTPLIWVLFSVLLIVMTREVTNSNQGVTNGVFKRCFSEWCVQRAVRIRKGRRHQNVLKHCQKNPRVRQNSCPQFWGRKWLCQFYGRPEKCVLSAGKICP